MTGTAPPTRNRAETEARIISAVRTILARDGFPAINISAVAAEAGVDKVLIYRYFGKIDDLLAAFGRSADFWPTVDEVVAPDMETMAPAERLTSFFDRYIEALRSRPLTIEILAMEVNIANPLTAALDAAREEWGIEIARRLGRGTAFDIAEMNTAVALVSAGIQFLLIRARRTGVFSQIAITNDADWAVVRQHLAWLSRRLVSEPASETDNPSP
jgi:AcrR family transcriptional regulator